MSHREDQTHKSNFNYQDIIHCMPDIVYILDKNCLLTEGNKNLLTWLGVEKLSDIKKTLYATLIDHKHFSAERVEHFKHDDIQALLSEEAQYDVEEHPVIDADGEIIYFSASRIPLFDKEKNVVGLVVILKDLSEQKKMIEQLERLKEQLTSSSLSKTSTASFSIRDNTEPPKILLIEDSIIAQRAAQALLMQLDCLVDAVNTGEKALALFEPGKYDLIFMDIGLENDSGYVVSKKIRQREHDSAYKVPIIALTSYEAEIVKVDCHDYFMEGAITKPLTQEQAKEIIERYIYKVERPLSGLKSL